MEEGCPRIQLRVEDRERIDEQGDAEAEMGVKRVKGSIWALGPRVGVRGGEAVESLLAVL